ncbi:MAG TPA: late competence development ComFB family protein [Spirochaetales bacterium]|nr:late competence development ComFB family protein [Spirochaetales bacterium]HPM72996.1 late competence development ComFB family protein [Spirochaetales bacterium]HQO65650.1 late competence development ComFB family protein [Spirochaetales bacterium]
MDIAKGYDLSFLVNDAERMVLDELGRVLDTAEGDGICVCQDCVVDMAALALNSLEPRYHASLLGTMYAHAAESGEYADQVRIAVAAAVRKVGRNPSHS